MDSSNLLNEILERRGEVSSILEYDYDDDYFEDLKEAPGIKCHACFGTGLDRYEDADCMECWGEGVLYGCV